MIDVSELRAEGGRFLRWWGSELAAMIPPGLGAKLPVARPAVDVRLLPRETQIERTQDGRVERFVDARALAELDDEAWSQLEDMAAGEKLRLILTPPHVYATELALPREAASRLHAVVALQLPEIAPLSPERLVWAARAVANNGERLRVRVIMTQRETINGLTATFADRDIEVDEVATDDGSSIVRLERRSRGMSLVTRRALMTVGLMILVPIVTAVLGTAMIWSNERTIDQIEDQAQLIARAERAERESEALRGAVAPLVAKRPTSDLLDGLASALPPSASLLEADRQQGGKLQLTVLAKNPSEVRSVLGARPWNLHEVDEAAQGEAMRMVVAGRVR